jgi:hypothetical protein
MRGELEPVTWRSSAGQKQHSRELATVQRQARLARAEVVGVAMVTNTAMAETMKINVVRREAERLVPDGTEQFGYIAWHGVLRMVSVIDEM